MTVDKFMVCVKDKRSLTGARAWVMGWGEVGTPGEGPVPKGVGTGWTIVRGVAGEVGL